MKKVLTVVIPTRNRASLAINAARSVLASEQSGAVQVIISDNSTDQNESGTLAQFAENLQGDTLTLVRPPRPLSMTEHWEWAVCHAEKITESSHFTILTDRMLFRPGAIQELLGIIAKYPGSVISYTYDRIHDDRRPVLFQPLPRSGHLLKLDSSHLLRMAANMRFASCLPRMLNSIAPRALLNSLRDRFETVFDSMSPDYCYCFRVLAQEASIIYYDKSVLLSYAHDRSNGAATARGDASRDHQDFLQTQTRGAINQHTDLPTIMTVGNAVINEYNFVKNECGDSKLPTVDKQAYMRFLAGEVTRFKDPDAVRACLEILTNSGYKARRASLVGTVARLFTSIALNSMSRAFDTVGEAIHRAQATRPLTHSVFFLLRRDIKGQKPF